MITFIITTLMYLDPCDFEGRVQVTLEEAEACGYELMELDYELMEI